MVSTLAMRFARIREVRKEEEGRLSKRNPPWIESPDVAPGQDSMLAQLLEDIEQEETPERLLKLARELQQQLSLRKQRETPS